MFDISIGKLIPEKFDSALKRHRCQKLFGDSRLTLFQKLTFPELRHRRYSHLNAILTTSPYVDFVCW